MIFNTHGNSQRVERIRKNDMNIHEKFNHSTKSIKYACKMYHYSEVQFFKSKFVSTFIGYMQITINLLLIQYENISVSIFYTNIFKVQEDTYTHKNSVVVFRQHQSIHVVNI